MFSYHAVLFMYLLNPLKATIVGSSKKKKSCNGHVVCPPRTGGVSVAVIAVVCLNNFHRLLIAGSSGHFGTRGAGHPLSITVHSPWPSP